MFCIPNLTHGMIKPNKEVRNKCEEQEEKDKKKKAPVFDVFDEETVGEYTCFGFHNANIILLSNMKSFLNVCILNGDFIYIVLHVGVLVRSQP